MQGKGTKDTYLFKLHKKKLEILRFPAVFWSKWLDSNYTTFGTVMEYNGKMLVFLTLQSIIRNHISFFSFAIREKGREKLFSMCSYHTLNIRCI